MAPDSWYWCLEHDRPEAEGDQCRADNRMGPYSSREEAVNWKHKADAREERWKEQDRQWEGETEDD